MCVPWARSRAVQSRHAGIDLRDELTDSPPGTEQGTDDVTECHTFGEDCGGPVPACRDRGPKLSAECFAARERRGQKGERRGIEFVCFLLSLIYSLARSAC